MQQFARVVVQSAQPLLQGFLILGFLQVQLLLLILRSVVVRLLLLRFLFFLVAFRRLVLGLLFLRLLVFLALLVAFFRLLFLAFLVLLLFAVLALFLLLLLLQQVLDDGLVGTGILVPLVQRQCRLVGGDGFLVQLAACQGVAQIVVGVRVILIALCVGLGGGLVVAGTVVSGAAPFR